MTEINTGTATPQKVRKLATTRAHLPRTALIGTFGHSGAFAALIRDSDGKITRVTVGDKAADGYVSAISAAKVIINIGKVTRTLRMPRA